MDFAFDARTEELRAGLLEFMDAHVYPAEAVFHEQLAALENRWAWTSVPEVLDIYAACSGRDLSDLGFYIALASFKAAVILEGIHFRYVHGQTVGEGFEEIGTLVEPLVASGLAAIQEDS